MSNEQGVGHGTVPHARSDSLRALRVLAAVLVLGAALFVGARPIGPAPALGAFLEPAHGVWSLARAAASPAAPDASVAGLGAPVEVVYDERAVPHIFAKTEDDAYRALGYVVARDRLFQLYTQTLASSGRLTEIGGAQALPLDREMRHLGLPRSAEELPKRLGDTSLTVRMARAFADGVNAYIARMPATELPLEFRLLGRRPPKWEPVDSYLLQNRMGWTLANIANERNRTAAAAKVGVLTGAMNNIPRNFNMLGSRQENAALLRAKGVEVALIGNAGGGDEEQFNVRNIRYEAGNAVAYGMKWDDALRAITLAPAELFGVSDRLGSLQAGRDANVVVWSGDPFEFATRPEHVFVRGKEYHDVSRQDLLMQRYKQLPPDFGPRP